MVTEILNKSQYPEHQIVAAMSGARIVERQESDQTEGVRRALVWLRDRQVRKQSEAIFAMLIASFEKRLAKATGQTIDH